MRNVPVSGMRKLHALGVHASLEKPPMQL